MYAKYLMDCSSYLLTSVISHAAQKYPESRPVKLSTEVLAQIPTDPSSLFDYLHRYESYEQMVMGQETHHSESSIAENLAQWEADWKAMGGK